MGFKITDEIVEWVHIQFQSGGGRAAKNPAPRGDKTARRTTRWRREEDVREWAGVSIWRSFESQEKDLIDDTMCGAAEEPVRCEGGGSCWVLDQLQFMESFLR